MWRVTCVSMCRCRRGVLLVRPWRLGVAARLGVLGARAPGRGGWGCAQQGRALSPFEVLYSLSKALKCPTLLRYAGSTVLDVPFEPFAAATVHAHIELDIELPVSCALVLSPALAHGDEPCKTEHDASSDDDRPQ